MMLKYLYSAFFILFLCGIDKIFAQQTPETLLSLSQKFAAPSAEYHPYVWWHWMGSNFSKEGITKDLEAMKESGIGGATIFNIASSAQENSFGVPRYYEKWPEQTFRSKAYWEALRFAAAEAKRLGLKLGIHNCPGYTATGGPWIPENIGMQTIVSSRKIVAGNQFVQTKLEKPELPVYKGWGSGFQKGGKQATFYRDIAVIAVHSKKDVGISDMLNITDKTDADGNLEWQAPEGEWAVYRIGHAPTMSNPQPVPDDLNDKVLEVDKMSREANVYHWQQILDPLTEHLKEYIGDSFTFIHIDSYEAGDQDWTPLFRDEFIRIKGYDPLPWIALQLAGSKRDDIEVFNRDFKDVKNRLFIDNGWAVAKEMINSYGLQFYWEPYEGPFDTYECISIPDVPMSEFWTSINNISTDFADAAKKYNKRVVAAEAFTGSPEISHYTEDPAFLKHSADGAFVLGVNQMFLHHWVHQPFDDKYQPGMGMGWWGTHFGRHQTWFKPGKEFISYLARCQMLLQQGSFVKSAKEMVHRQTPEADIFFVTNPSSETRKSYSFPIKGRIPELWDAYDATIRYTTHYREEDNNIVIDLNLLPDKSVFVVFPYHKSAYAVLPEKDVVNETSQAVSGSWQVSFEPKLDKPFKRNLPVLVDFSKLNDDMLKYFAGTAKYEKTVAIAAVDLAKDKRILLDLGELYDIAELEINGQHAGVLWSPPYMTDITPYLKKGSNKIAVYVSVNWANRLIGDEQYEADFEWGTDRGEKMGRAMKAYPEWFLKDEPRPSKGRKTFNIWYYFRKDSPLQPAGLVGPVQIIRQTVKIN